MSERSAISTACQFVYMIKTCCCNKWKTSVSMTLWAETIRNYCVKLVLLAHWTDCPVIISKHPVFFLFLFLVCWFYCGFIVKRNFKNKIISKHSQVNSEKTGTFMPFTCSSVGFCSITEFEEGLYLSNAVKLTTIQSKVQNFLSSLFQSPPVGWIGVFAGILTLKPYV